MGRKTVNKLMISLIMMTMIFLVMPRCVFALEGDGTEQNPYRISDYSELKDFADIVNGENGKEKNVNACALITANISIQDVPWTPIGKGDSYKGTFDGGGYTINGLKLESENDYVGLFGKIDTGAVVKNTRVNISNLKGKSGVGGIAGYNYGTIKNCYTTGTISGVSCIGGIAGYNYFIIENCYNTGTISGSSLDFGGIAGTNGGIIKNSHNAGTITIENSEAGHDVGGIAGCNYNSIEKCFNNGVVSGKNMVGGVTGLNLGLHGSASVKFCYNTGEVSATNMLAGGMTGKCEDSDNTGGSIEYCYNSGKVSATNKMAGGMTGFLNIEGDGGIYNCYNVGEISGQSILGGITGDLKEGSIKWSYYDNYTSNTNRACYDNSDSDFENVKGLSTEEMTGTEALSTGHMIFENNEVWLVKANTTEDSTVVCFYPHLKGFNYDQNGEQLNADQIAADDWPAQRVRDKVATPTFDPAGGDFTSSVSVTLRTATENAKIYYTTDGSDPASNGTEYKGSVNISETTKIRAIAVKDDMLRSDEASATYTIKRPDPVKTTYKVNLKTEGNGTATVSANSAEAGTTITINATPADKYEFVKWTVTRGVNLANAKKANTTFKMPKKDITVTAHFAKKTYAITVKTEGKGSANASANSSKAGKKITIKATPNVKYKFVKWKASKGVELADATKATTTFTMPEKKVTVTAVFEKIYKAPQVKITTKGDNKLFLEWWEVKDAEGYDIFISRCNYGGKETVPELVKTIKGNKTHEWTVKGLEKGKSYKAYVSAYVTGKNGKKKYISKSPLMHIYTAGGTKNYTNAKSVKLDVSDRKIKKVKKENRLTLNVKETYGIKASVVKSDKKKKLMPKDHVPTLRYRSSNPNIATVSSKGKVTGKRAGSCSIYVYAHNGVNQTIKLTVE